MRKYITLVLLAAISCQENTVDPTLVYDNIMRFNLTAPCVATKVTADGFEATDYIGLYVADYVNDATPMPLQISGNRANNLIMTFDGSAWIPEETIYWGEGKSDVYAYYPYVDKVADINDHYFEVATDQTGCGYESSDFLWAKAEGVRQDGGTINLDMKHLMSKLTVRIVAGKDYIGSLPNDATVLLHSTVTGVRVNLETGAIKKDPYSSARSIKMKNLGVKMFADGNQAVVYEAIVVPQMIESSLPLIEINSKSVSYLLEDFFNFRSGVAYTYTVTLNASTMAIKVDIGCELEDWNNGGGTSGGGNDGEGGESGGDDATVYDDLSAEGTANCYLIQATGDYMFKAAIGNTEATVGNVKAVEVLWESFGTDDKPNIGDLISNVKYVNGYVCFSTPQNFRDGNAVIAVKNSKGVILWSWHIWCCKEGWKEQVYYNGAGTMMDRNLGATSSIPGDLTVRGLIYQWGRKDPFLGASGSDASFVASTGTWLTASSGTLVASEINPTTFYWSDTVLNRIWDTSKTIYDPCPLGWRVSDGGPEGVWARACGENSTFSSEGIYDKINKGANFSGVFGDDELIWYPGSGGRKYNDGSPYYVGDVYCWSSSPYDISAYGLYVSSNHVFPTGSWNRDYGFSVRCQKEN